jgi:hypothetical protein
MSHTRNTTTMKVFLRQVLHNSIFASVKKTNTRSRRTTIETMSLSLTKSTITRLKNLSQNKLNDQEAKTLDTHTKISFHVNIHTNGQSTVCLCINSTSWDLRDTKKNSCRFVKKKVHSHALSKQKKNKPWWSVHWFTGVLPFSTSFLSRWLSCKYVS